MSVMSHTGAFRTHQRGPMSAAILTGQHVKSPPPRGAKMQIRPHEKETHTQLRRGIRAIYRAVLGATRRAMGTQLALLTGTICVFRSPGTQMCACAAIPLVQGDDKDRQTRWRTTRLMMTAFPGRPVLVGTISHAKGCSTHTSRTDSLGEPRSFP